MTRMQAAIYRMVSHHPFCYQLFKCQGYLITTKTNIIKTCEISLEVRMNRLRTVLFFAIDNCIEKTFYPSMGCLKTICTDYEASLQ